MAVSSPFSSGCSSWGGQSRRHALRWGCAPPRTLNIRTCHFDQGIIRERISIWEPPHRLVLAITEVTLPGRDWLQFIDASYELGATSSGETRVRRTTKLGSVLRPRFYWEPLEALATEVEHEYLLNALGTKLGDLPAVDPHTTGVPPEQPAGLGS